jgi:hypothetical protein
LRKTATKAVKVQPGDEIIVRAALPPDLGLARLYVWAKEGESTNFSPYVLDTDVIPTNGMPQMLTPLSMRLVPQRSIHKISFLADIRGQIVIVQEVDTKEDKIAKVSLEVNMATTSRLSRFKRRLTEWPKTVTL